MSRTVKQGQSFLDKVLELTGNIENAFAMTKSNSLSTTAQLAIGQDIIPAGTARKSIMQQWDENNIPATAMTDSQQAVILPPDGIGAMIIEDTFIIS